MSFFSKHRAGSGGYRIGRLFRISAKLFDRLVLPTGLTRGQIPVLMEVLHEPGRSQQELSRVLHIDAAATARTLQTLEEAGLVERTENPHCRRDKCVHPTPRAEKLLPGLLESLERHNEVLFTGFTPRERTDALSFLDRLVENAERTLDRTDNDS